MPNAPTLLLEQEPELNDFENLAVTLSQNKPGGVENTRSSSPVHFIFTSIFLCANDSYMQRVPLSRQLGLECSQPDRFQTKRVLMWQIKGNFD